VTSLRILYVGLNSGTSQDRANAYRRLGHQVEHVDTRLLLPTSGLIDHITWHLGDNLLAPFVRGALRHMLTGKHYDLCHVDNGEWINGDTVQLLKQHCTKVINYNIDDPTGPRDTKRFNCYRQALPFYDLVAVVRPENLSEVAQLGASNIVRVHRSADEVTHAPRQLNEEDHRRWHSQVLFLGTWMPERGPFLSELIRLKVPITIRGDRWHKANEWPTLAPYWKGGHIVNDDYAKAIQCASINLGLLSVGNRDQHTTRSLEIPAMGGLLCAQRTPEHLAMYNEGQEALFWSNAKECAEISLWALAHPEIAVEIAAHGKARYLRNQYTNENIMKQLIARSYSTHDK